MIFSRISKTRLEILTMNLFAHQDRINYKHVAIGNKKYHQEFGLENALMQIIIRE